MRPKFFSSRSSALWLLSAVSSAAIGLGACNNDSQPVETGSDAGAADASTETAPTDGSNVDVATDTEQKDTAPPTFAGVKTATALADDAIVVSWDAATDNVSPAAKIVYRVYLATATGAQVFTTPTAVTPAGATSATLMGLDPVREYFVVVRAVDEAGNEDANTIQASIATADHIGPYFAGVKTVTAAGKGEVAITWDSANDKATPKSEIVYRIYTSKVSGGQDFTTPTVTTAAGALSHKLTNLDDFATYFVVVRAVDKAGNEEKNKKELSSQTIDATPPVFAGVAEAKASGITTKLTWAAGTDNVTLPGALVYNVYRAVGTGAFDFTTPFATTAAGTTELTAVGLTISTTYRWVVRAKDAAGNEEKNTKELSATTDAKSDVTPPTFAGADTATALTVNSATINWTAATDNEALPAAIVYDVFIALGTGGHNFSAPTYSSAPGATSYPVTGLLPNTTYYAVVRARDPSGNSDTNVKEVAFKTSADVTAPTFAGLRTATALSSLSVKLDWSAATDNTSAASDIKYRVYFATTSGGQNFAAPITTTSNGATSIVYSSGLAPDSTYYYVVRAVDAFGNEDTNVVERSVTTAKDLVAPIFSGATTAVASSETSVKVSWALATDDTTSQTAITYSVCCSTNAAACTNIPFASSIAALANTTALEVTGLLANTTYTCNVRAVDAYNNTSAGTTTVSVKTNPDVTPPVFGGATGVTGASATSLTVNWGVATDNVTPASQIKFYVCRDTVTGGCSGTNFNLPSSATHVVVGPLTNVNSYTVSSGLAPNTQYFFVVRAEDTALPTPNRALNSVEVSGQTVNDAVAPTLTGTVTQGTTTVNTVQISYPAGSDNVAVTSYDVCVSLVATGCDGGAFAAWPQTVFNAATTATLSNLQAGKNYYIKVRARDAAGNMSTPTISTASGFVTTSTDSAGPTFGNTTVTLSSFTNTGMTATWVAPTDNDAVGTKTYELCWGLAAAADCTWPGGSPTTANLTYAITGLLANTSYKVRVRARDASTNLSTNSASGTGSTTADVTPPGVPAISSVTPSCGQASVAFSTTTDNATPAGSIRYDVCTTTVSGGCASASFVSSGFSTGSSPAIATSITTGKNRYFVIRASDQASPTPNYSYSAQFGTVNMDSTAPTNPASIFAIASCGSSSSGAVSLDWGTSTDSCAGSGIVYRVCRTTVGSESACDSSFSATYSTGTASDLAVTSGLNFSSAYKFYVRAEDGYGNQSASVLLGGGAVTTKMSFNANVQSVWNTSASTNAGAPGGCAGCHAFTHATTVNIAGSAAGCGATAIIVPNSTANSHMYRRVANISSCGIMPPTGYYVPANFATTLATWINEGACDN